MAKIYALVDSRNLDDYRYIGKTINPLECRLYHHKYRIHSDKNLHKVRWMTKVLNDGADIAIVLLEECNDELQDEREIFWIKQCRSDGYNLTNLTDGGEGGCNPNPEVREKIRKGLLGKKRPKYIIEILRENGKKYIGAANPNFGNRWSEEQRHDFSIKRKELSKGELNPASKLTEGDVKCLYQDRKDGMRVKDIMVKYGITKTSVFNIMSGVTWSHLNLGAKCY